MLKRVGFFHFGTGHADPIGALKAELEANAELKISGAPAQADDDQGDGDAQADTEPETLIVLPEAFNIKKLYRTEGKPDTKPDVLGELQALSAKSRGYFPLSLFPKPCWTIWCFLLPSLRIT
jgi:hypothetical protein